LQCGALAHSLIDSQHTSSLSCCASKTILWGGDSPQGMIKACDRAKWIKTPSASCCQVRVSQRSADGLLIRRYDLMPSNRMPSSADVLLLMTHEFVVCVGHRTSMLPVPSVARASPRPSCRVTLRTASARVRSPASSASSAKCRRQTPPQPQQQQQQMLPACPLSNPKAHSRSGHRSNSLPRSNHP
jgi:hypothetical protein